jgi:hypothetical protein
MGAAAGLIATGLAVGSVTSAISSVQRANAEVAASKMRQAEAQRLAFAKAEQIRREGDAFIAEQRVQIGGSGVERSGSPLRLLASNAEAVEHDAALSVQEGINIATIEEARRSSIRESRDQSIMTSLLLPGGSPQGFTALGAAVSGERFGAQGTLARQLTQTRLGVPTRRLGRVGTRD